MTDRSGATIETVAVVGTGLIGASWTALFLSKGLSVRATDPADGAEDRLRQFVELAQADLRRLDPGCTTGASRLSFVADLDVAVAGADFVQENAPESLALKQALLAQVDAAAYPSAVIASSTSTFMASDLQASCRRPERVLVAHPFNPPHLIPLVEVVGGVRTAPEAVQTCLAFYESLGKSPIHLKREVLGHVANRLAAALWREAVSLVAEGTVSVADIDRAVADGPGLRWGVFGPNLLYHLGGGPGGMAAYLDHLGPTQEARWKTLGKPKLTAAVRQRLIDGVAEEAGGRSIDALARERDDALVALLALRAKRPIAGPKV